MILKCIVKSTEIIKKNILVRVFYGNTSEKSKANAYIWKNYSILLILLLHIFKVSGQILYKEIELERTLCRNWNENIKDDKNEILVYVTGLLWGHNTKAIQNTGRGKVFFQAQAQWFQGLVQSLRFPWMYQNNYCAVDFYWRIISF